MRKKVLLAMSGGIDSSVAAILLQKKGYEVIGVTFILNEFKNGFDNNVIDAKIVAEKLNIKHYTLDLKQEFNDKIINYFIESYSKGLTPNPCSLCNPTIKFKSLIDFADKLGIEKISTGHYTYIKNKNKKYFFSKSSDEWKDQTYFLWNLPQNYIKRTVLPLSKIKKNKVKKIARKYNFFHLLYKKESYDVCFVKGGNYRDFILERNSGMNLNIKPGNIVDENGEIVGKHNGIINYTIGQRRGLGIEKGIPFYVKSIDKENNLIIVSPKEKVVGNAIIVKDINLSKYNKLPQNARYLTKIRYRDPGKMATINIEGNLAKVIFDYPVYAISPGQSVVFYEGNDLVGGGIIT